MALQEVYLPGDTRQTKSANAEDNVCVTTDANDLEECLWEGAIANSIDAIRELADKARAERRAGRTKKITL